MADGSHLEKNPHCLEFGALFYEVTSPAPKWRDRPIPNSEADSGDA